MADPFSFREVGDPAAVGSKYGSVAGHETRVIYPEQKLTRGEFKPGRVILEMELRWHGGVETSRFPSVCRV